MSPTSTPVHDTPCCFDNFDNFDAFQRDDRIISTRRRKDGNIPKWLKPVQPGSGPRLLWHLVDAERSVTSHKGLNWIFPSRHKEVLLILLSSVVVPTMIQAKKEAKVEEKLKKRLAIAEERHAKKSRVDITTDTLVDM